MLDGRLRHRIRVRVRLGKCLVEVELSQQHEIADTARVLSQQHAIADAGRCLGIRCNIWARSKRRSEITHALQGGGDRNGGWDALRWQDLAGPEVTRLAGAECWPTFRKRLQTFSMSFELLTFQA